MPDDGAATVETGLPTAVLVCEDLANLGAGLNLEELRSSLEAMSPVVGVHVVPDLCRNSGQLPPVVARQGAARAVLGLCSGEYPQVELQARARKAGLDPFGVEVVPLGTLCARVHPGPQATWKARALLAAAVARARAFQGSGPEHAKLHFLPLNQRVTRRSLFTVPPIGYQPVPSILRERCVAEAGCHLCASACPRGGLRRVRGHLLMDKSRCDGCGVCLAACPREALHFPSWSSQQLEAQLAALLASVPPGGESLGLLLTCQRALGKLEELAPRDVSYSHRWLPVMVPCLGMVTQTWLLEALAHGAEAVALLSCGQECPSQQAQVIGGRANFCRRLLPLMGQAPDRVRVLSASQPKRLLQALQEPPPLSEVRPSRLGGPWQLGTLEGASRAIRYLAEVGGASSGVALEHPHSPFGKLELPDKGCTACLTCVEACPTGALASDRGGDEVTLTWLASSCTACGMCAEVCPEANSQVLRVRRVVNLDTWSAERVILHRERFVTCEGCGTTIISQALLHRLEATLEGSSEALHTALSRYCPSCRSPFAWGAVPSSLHKTQALEESEESVPGHSQG